MSKRGSSLTLNIIVVAILVLIVMIVVFSGKFSQFNKGVSNCEDKGGTNVQRCVYDATECSSIGGVIVPDKCEVKENVCCFLLNPQDQV